MKTYLTKTLMALASYCLITQQAQAQPATTDSLLVLTDRQMVCYRKDTTDCRFWNNINIDGCASKSKLFIYTAGIENAIVGRIDENGEIVDQALSLAHSRNTLSYDPDTKQFTMEADVLKDIPDAANTQILWQCCDQKAIIAYNGEAGSPSHCYLIEPGRINAKPVSYKVLESGQPFPLGGRGMVLPAAKYYSANADYAILGRDLLSLPGIEKIENPYMKNRTSDDQLFLFDKSKFTITPLPTTDTLKVKLGRLLNDNRYYTHRWNSAGSTCYRYLQLDIKPVRIDTLCLPGENLNLSQYLGDSLYRATQEGTGYILYKNCKVPLNLPPLLPEEKGCGVQFYNGYISVLSRIEWTVHGIPGRNTDWRYWLTTYRLNMPLLRKKLGLAP